jgi:two-component system response regulator HydG
VETVTDLTELEKARRKAEDAGGRQGKTPIFGDIIGKSHTMQQVYSAIRAAGAIRDRAGRFEEADGGTSFLDEIGEISPFIQVKFLRVLQEREIERVGESKKRKIDLRIIAATNQDLLALVKEGNFREDLFYRPKVYPITIPPLRKRKEDIPLKRVISR